MTKKTESICVRLSESDIEMLEDLMFWLNHDTGIEVSKSSVLRWCLVHSHANYESGVERE